MMKFLTFLFAITLASCGGSETDSQEPVADPRVADVLEDVNSAQQLWDSHELIDYSFAYHQRVNQACGDGVADEAAPSYRVTVDDDVITSVTNYDSGQEIDPPTGDHFGTFDEMFAYLKAELESGPQVVAKSWGEQSELPTFDDSFGFPINYYLEFNDSDECYSIKVSIDEFM
ncbi:MAG: DUF6174 domain-containing protein [Pseudomonadota bacterium]